jgi:hypothetical protein
MAHDVFVSYSSKDKPTADAVCAVLESHGIRCWVAPRDILPGSDWGGSIIEAINGARTMVLVFSAHANASLQIKREVERAVNKGIPVIPLRIEDVVPTASLEYFISTPHWLDAFAPPLERHLQYLAEVVRKIVGGPEGSIPLSVSESESREKSETKTTQSQPAIPPVAPASAKRTKQSSKTKRAKDTISASKELHQQAGEQGDADTKRIFAKRPISVTVIAWLLLVVSSLSLVAVVFDPHTPELMANRLLPVPVLYFKVFVTALIYMLSGIFMLRGARWARMLYLVWGGIVSTSSLLESVPKLELITEFLIYAIIVFFLFRPKASAYFSGSAYVESGFEVEAMQSPPAIRPVASISAKRAKQLPSKTKEAISAPKESP